MAFVNEYISDEDFSGYGLEKIDAQFFATGIHRRDWTIDKERNIYLRQVTGFREGMEQMARWSFYWKGNIIWLDRKVLSASGTRGGIIRVHAQLRILQLPQHLEEVRDELFNDLKSAFMAYRDGGVFDKSQAFEMELDIVINAEEAR